MDESPKKHRRRRRREAADKQSGASEAHGTRRKHRSLWRRLHLPDIGRVGRWAAVLVVLAGGAIAWWWMSPGFVDARLRSELDRALAEGEFATAAERFHDLEDGGYLSPHDLEIRVESAKVCAALNELDEARRIMQQAARLNHAGAHLWLAQDLLASMRSQGAAFLEEQKNREEAAARAAEQQFHRMQFEKQKRAESHVARTLALEPENVEANRLMSRMNLSARRWKETIENLNRLMVDGDENRLLLARVYNLNGQQDRAAEEARRVLESTTAKMRSNPTDEKNVSMAVVAALMVGEYADSAHLLETSLKQGLASSQLDMLRAMTYLGWAQKTLAGGPKSYPATLDLLELSLAGSHVPPESLLLLYQFATRPESAVRARDLIHTALARGQAPAKLHRILGDLAERESHTLEAMRHYQAAVDSDPQEAIARNNLAWLMASREDPDLPQALELVNESLRIAPGFPRYRDTRGQILVRMGHDHEALPDLLSAVGSMPDNVALHRALAGVYLRLNVPELAAKHQDRVKVLGRPAGPLPSK